MEGEKLAFMVRFVAGAVFAGWIMIWIMVPTTTYRQRWRPSILDDTSSKYLGTQGSNILIYAFPVLFMSVLGCAYAHLQKRSSYSKRTTRLSFWRRPLLVKGPLGIVSAVEAAFFLMFLILIVWCFSTYLRVSFSKISPASSAKNGEKLWEARLESTGLRLGLVGNICLAFLFFPVTRGSSLLPLVGLTSESSVRYHIWVGHIVMALFTAHGFCYIIFWKSTGNISEMIKWSKADVSNIAGELSLLCGLALWATTIPRIRRKMFEIFFYTHQLYVLFLLFFLLHVGISFFCLVLPGVFLFAVHRFLRFLQSGQKVQLLSARLLPGDSLELNFAKQTGFEYSAASVVFINVPSISKLQWHPFTVSSSSSLEPDKLSVIIKKEGSWTQKLYQKLSSPSAIDSLDVSLEGPYGHASNHFLGYHSLVLISGGGGITPFISMIRESIHASKSPSSSVPSIHLVCAFKSSADLSILNLLIPFTIETHRLNLHIDAFVTREKELIGESKKNIRSIWFKPSPSQIPIYPILGANAWLWLGAVISSSFMVYLVMLGFLNRYYIYPIDKNTNKVYSWSARAILNLLLLSASIGGLASAATMRIRSTIATQSNRLRVVEAPTPMGTPYYLGEGRELESLPEESIVQVTKVHYGMRPDLKKMLMECTESNTGVFVSGPAALHHDVATICASGLMDSLHFESVSFNW